MNVIIINGPMGVGKTTVGKYIADHQPDHAIRFSKRGYRKDGYITNLPLYLARKTKDLL